MIEAAQRPDIAQEDRFSLDPSFTAEYLDLNLVCLTTLQECIDFTRDSGYDTRLDRGRAFIEKSFENSISYGQKYERDLCGLVTEVRSRLFATIFKNTAIWLFASHWSHYYGPAAEALLTCLLDDDCDSKLDASWPQQEGSRRAAYRILRLLPVVLFSEINRQEGLSTHQSALIPTGGD